MGLIMDSRSKKLLFENNISEYSQKLMDLAHEINDKTEKNIRIIVDLVSKEISKNTNNNFSTIAIFKAYEDTNVCNPIIIDESYFYKPYNEKFAKETLKNMLIRLSNNSFYNV